MIISPGPTDIMPPMGEIVQRGPIIPQPDVPIMPYYFREKRFHGRLSSASWALGKWGQLALDEEWEEVC